MSQDTSKLKQELRQLRIGDQVDNMLDKAVALGEPTFALVYQPLNRPERWSEFHLNFYRNKNGSYSLGTSDVYLYKHIEKLPRQLNGVRISALQASLASIDWAVQRPSADLQQELEDARENLQRLRQTEEGKKVANLLVARYGSAVDQEDKSLTPLEFDRTLNLYYISRSFDPLKEGPIDQVHARIVNEMESTIPHMYQVELTMTDLSTGMSRKLVNGSSLGDFGAAGQLFIQVSPIHFDQSAMEQLGLPSKVEAVSIYDRVDGMRVATKTVQTIEEGSERPTVKVDLNVNEEKMPILEFVRLVDVLAFDDSLDKGKIEAIREQFAPKRTSEVGKSQVRQQELRPSKPKRSHRGRAK